MKKKILLITSIVMIIMIALGSVAFAAPNNANAGKAGGANSKAQKQNWGQQKQELKPLYDEFNANRQTLMTLREQCLATCATVNQAIDNALLDSANIDLTAIKAKLADIKAQKQELRLQLGNNGKNNQNINNARKAHDLEALRATLTAQIQNQTQRIAQLQDILAQMNALIAQIPTVTATPANE